MPLLAKMVKAEMGLQIRWHSKQGQRTKDNRDHGGVGLREGSALCVVLDGSSSSDDSGEFARLIAKSLIDWFVGATDVTTDTIINKMRAILNDLSTEFRKGSASFVGALLDDNGEVHLLHSGDCLAGISECNTDINWLTRPHTLANAIDDLTIEEIAQSPVRNRITRSFRSREFFKPVLAGLTLNSEMTLALATDGFWAALSSDDKSRFLAGDEIAVSHGRDDCSALTIRILDGSQEHDVAPTEAANFFVAISQA